MKRLILSLLLLTAPILAESGGVSTILYLENEASILPADASPAVQAGLNVPLYPGDRLDTARSGRLEAALAEGSLLWVDQGSKLELRSLALTEGFSDQRSYLFLQEGQAAFEAFADPVQGGETVLGFAGGDFYAFAAGLYSVELRGRAAYLRLYSGRGELVTDRGSVLLKAGEEAIAYEDGFVDRRRLRSGADGFSGWVEQRRELRLRSQSTQYTGDALSSYSYQLDQNGSWVYMPDIAGYAWRPVVAVGWQPYYDGYWRSSPSGWFWVGYEPWGYVTYHYGRWSMFPGYGWMWVPGYDWAPAWVYWYYDSFNIGWSPVGYWDYWWWNGCNNCWGWNDHHGHHHGDHDGDHDGDHGRDDYRHIGGHVSLSKLDHRAFVFADANQFGKGKTAFTHGPELKGRLDSNGAIKALDLPLGRTDLDNPGPVLKKAVLEAKDDLTPLFKKDFTATPQAKQIFTTTRAKALESATAPVQRITGRPAVTPRGDIRSAELPSGQVPQRLPMRERSVTPSRSSPRPVGGEVTPAPETPARDYDSSPAPSRRPSSAPSGSVSRPSSGTVTPSPRPSSGHSGTPAPAPSPSGKVSPAPSSQPAPSVAPSEPKKAEPSKSSFRITNLQDDGGNGTIRIEDSDRRLRSRDRQTGSVSVAGEARWERSRAPVEVSASATPSRRPVATRSSSPTRTPVYYDRQPVSGSSRSPSTQRSGGDAYHPSPSYNADASTPSRPSYSYSSSSSRSAPSNSGRSYSAPSPSYSAPSGSSRSTSAPSHSGRSSSAPAPSSSSSSGKSPSHSHSSSSSSSSSSHSAPKK